MSFLFLKICLGSHNCKWSCWRTGQVKWKNYSTLLVPRGEAEMATYSTVNWSVSVLPLSASNTTDVSRIVTRTGNKMEKDLQLKIKNYWSKNLKIEQNTLSHSKNITVIYPNLSLQHWNDLILSLLWSPPIHFFFLYYILCI